MNVCNPATLLTNNCFQEHQLIEELGTGIFATFVQTTADRTQLWWNWLQQLVQLFLVIPALQKRITKPVTEQSDGCIILESLSPNIFSESVPAVKWFDGIKFALIQQLLLLASKNVQSRWLLGAHTTISDSCGLPFVHDARVTHSEF